MPKNNPSLPSELPSVSAAQKLLNLCNEIAPSLGNEKIKVELSRNGGEITQKTAQGMQRIQIAPGYQEVSQGNIRGLPLEQQKAAVQRLRDLGLNQSQIAIRLNVCQARISQIENQN